jgi:hypothetical protein
VKTSGIVCRIGLTSPAGYPSSYVFYTGDTYIPKPVIKTFEASAENIDGTQVSQEGGVVFHRYDPVDTPPLAVTTNESRAPVKLFWNTAYTTYNKIAANEGRDAAAIGSDIQLDGRDLFSDSITRDLEPGPCRDGGDSGVSAKYPPDCDARTYPFTFFSTNNREATGGDDDQSWVDRKKVNVSVTREPLSLHVTHKVISDDLIAGATVNILWKTTGAAQRIRVRAQMNLAHCGVKDPCIEEWSTDLTNGAGSMTFDHLDAGDTQITITAFDGKGREASRSFNLREKITLSVLEALTEGFENGVKFYEKPFFEFAGKCGFAEQLCAFIQNKISIQGIFGDMLGTAINFFIPGLGTLTKFLLPIFSGLIGMIVHPILHLAMGDHITWFGGNDLSILLNMVKGAIPGLIGSVVSQTIVALVGDSLNCLNGAIKTFFNGLFGGAITGIANLIDKGLTSIDDFVKEKLPFTNVESMARSVPVVGSLLGDTVKNTRYAIQILKKPVPAITQTIADAAAGISRKATEQLIDTAIQQTGDVGDKGYLTGMKMGNLAGEVIGNTVGKAIIKACGDICAAGQEFVKGAVDSLIPKELMPKECKSTVEQPQGTWVWGEWKPDCLTRQCKRSVSECTSPGTGAYACPYPRPKPEARACTDAELLACPPPPSTSKMKCTEWDIGSFGLCSKTCYKNSNDTVPGKRTRTVVCSNPAGCCAPQPSSEENCTPTQKCPDEKCVPWSNYDWSNCSQKCDGGTTKALYRCEKPGKCCGTAPEESKPCNKQACYGKIERATGDCTPVDASKPNINCAKTTTYRCTTNRCKDSVPGPITASCVSGPWSKGPWNCNEPTSANGMTRPASRWIRCDSGCCNASLQPAISGTCTRAQTPEMTGSIQVQDGTIWVPPLN